jgi:hypothetical protein
MVIPNHHSGDFRYATPSPAVCPACARRRPFFLNTKLEPMRTPLATARITPTILRLLPAVNPAAADVEADGDAVDVGVVEDIGPKDEINEESAAQRSTVLFVVKPGGIM